MKLHRQLFSVCLLLALMSAAVAAVSESKDAPKPDADGWYELFNGKNLDGWKVSTDNPDTIKVENGEIVVHGERAHLFYDGPVNNHDFKNFEWKCEILTKPNANSGMYFHTKYQADGWPANGIEVQVNNSSGDPRRTGSIYRVKDIMNDSPAKDNEWFTQHVIVQGRKVTVKVNDKVVNEYKFPKDYQREEGWEKNVLGHGTFALQGHDPGSEVHYRSVKVKPLPKKEKKAKT